MIYLKEQIIHKNLEYNIDYIKNKTDKKIIAVLKSNAYNHKINSVLEAIINKGISFFAVESIEEARIIRKTNNDVQILILNPIDENNILEAEKNNYILTITSLNDFLLFEERTSERLECHLNIDTGMNRFGINFDKKLILIMKKLLIMSSKLNITGIYTHFYDGLDYKHTLEQYNKFIKIINFFDKLGKDFKYIHSQSSNTALNYNFAEMTHIRIGSIIYGIDETEKYNLLPVKTLYTNLIHQYEVNKGETISYGAKYRTNEKIIVGIVPIGYRDGYFLDENIFKPYLLIENKRMKVISVTMNSTIIKLDRFYDRDTKVYLYNEKNNILTMKGKKVTAEYLLFLNK